MNRPRAWQAFLVGVFLASVAGNLWQSLSAHPPRIFVAYGPRPGVEDDPPPLDLVDELALSPEQRASLIDRVEPLESERKELEAALATRVDELRSEILAAEPAAERIAALQAEVADHRTKILALRIEVLRRLREVLEPEQREVLVRRFAN